MRRMLVTGGGGLLGGEIVRAFETDWTVVVTDVAECDVTRHDAVRSAFDRHRPEVVVHCAAYTAVDRAEEERERAHEVNERGTRNVARACRDGGALLVAFGTDYIFDGAKGTPYVEEDAANPLSAYGASKWAAERALREEAPAHVLVRSQWLYGSGGRNFVSAILEKARRGEPLRVVADQVGCPTYARDLAEATRRLLSVGARGTFHFSNSGETSWYGFAEHIVGRALPGRIDLRPARSSEMPYPAARPPYSVLSKEKYRRTTGEAPRPWREAADEFLDGVRPAEPPGGSGADAGRARAR